jgi:dienelactone hydrolase
MERTAVRTQPVRIETPEAVLHGDLTTPDGSSAVILFAHGSGSSRHSPRNRRVAAALREHGFATLLIDLLTEEEEREDLRTGAFRFDIARLARRLASAVDWAADRAPGSEPRIGLFGASTGAAAALVAAADRPANVRAVVSRGGRPDLAGRALTRVTAQTLLIVGGDDVPVVELNRQALSALQSTKRMEIAAGATHLFEEPGALEQVARLASSWFVRYVNQASV